AKDVGTTVTGIQTAITLYTLVMAALMITGAKVGAMIGRKRAFAIGCVIYGCGSFTTSIAQNYATLLIGWSFLEGVGAALILSATGLALFVFGILKTGTWGWFLPKEGGPSWGGLSPSIWMMIGGIFVVWLFFAWEHRREDRGQEPLVRPAMLRNSQLVGGLVM